MLTYTTTVVAVGSGDTELLPASPTFSYAVLGYQITGKDAINSVKLKIGSAVKAELSCCSVAGGGICCPPTEIGYFMGTAKNENLAINVSGAGTVSVCVQYNQIGR